MSQGTITVNYGDNELNSTFSQKPIELVYVVNQSGGGGTTEVDATLVGAQRTVALNSYSANQLVAAGAKYIQIIFSADFTGTVAGVAFDGADDASWDITAPPGDTLGSVQINRTTGSVRVTTIT